MQFRKVRSIGPSWGKCPPPPNLGSKLLQRMCLYLGKRPLLHHSVVLKVPGGNWLFAIFGHQNTYNVLFFTSINPYLPCTVLLAHSSTVFVSKSCAICALNTSMGAYHHKLREVRGKRLPPPFQGQSGTQGGRGHIP